jgi:hypothetical protein
MKENVYNLKIVKKSQKSNTMSKYNNQSVWFILDYDKHAYAWTLHVSRDNDIMVDVQLVMESKNNL